MDGIGPPQFYEEHTKKGWFSSIYRFIQRRTKVVTVTTTYAVASDVWLVLCDASGGAFTVILPLSSQWGGREIVLRKIDTSANAITIGLSGSDALKTAAATDGFPSMTVAADGGSNWYII